MNSEKRLIILTGLTIGVLGALLVKFGNPANMGFCIACFVRDITGALGFHQAKVVQYLRPEIIGMILGAFISSLFFREFGSRGGSAPMLRFLLGMLMMIGALMFLGCPLRAVLRFSGGDLTAVAGILGVAAGAVLGTEFLKRGYNLGRSTRSPLVLPGITVPFLALGLLALLVLKPVFNPAAGGPIFFSQQGPGSQHVLWPYGLGAGLLVGVLAQRTRLCLSGGIRDYYLIRDPHLLWGYLMIFIGALMLNLLLGQFHLGTQNQPVAHNYVVWNFLGLMLTGLCAVLLGGCPLRQLIMAGEGDLDAGIAVVGMVAGAAVAHNFLLAASTAGPTTAGKIAVVGGLVIASLIGWLCREE